MIRNIVLPSQPLVSALQYQIKLRSMKYWRSPDRRTEVGRDKEKSEILHSILTQTDGVLFQCGDPPQPPLRGTSRWRPLPGPLLQSPPGGPPHLGGHDLPGRRGPRQPSLLGGGRLQLQQLEGTEDPPPPCRPVSSQ